MAAGDLDGSGADELIVDFGAGPGLGLYVYWNNSSWERVHNSSPESMITGALSGPSINLAPFISRATYEPCAGIRNRLFVIDWELVYWDRVGECSDFTYAKTLFGSTLDNILCTSHDSIAGPIFGCNDPSYQEMFITMGSNLDDPNLGLTPDHFVEEIPVPPYPGKDGK